MKNYLINQILNKYEESNVDWNNKQKGNRSIKIQQKHYDELQSLLEEGNYQGYGIGAEHTPDREDFYTGRECLLKEVRWLKQYGLLEDKKKYVHDNDIEKIEYSLENILKFYEITGREPKFVQVDAKIRMLRNYQQKVKSDWLKQYYQERIEKVEHGKITKRNATKEETEKELEKNEEQLFLCLSAIESLRFPMYIRTFSTQYLGGSKIFEESLKTKILSIARKYHPFVDETMEEYQIYEQLYLDTYSQELALKGSLKILLDGQEIDLSVFSFGTILNSETLKRAEPAQEQKIKKVITVENKANFVSMPYEENALILFSHGFFSPLERDFLKKLESVLDGDVEYLHTGDLDYGGIRIFQYIQNKIFPKLQPYQMSVEQYRKYEHRAVDIEQSVLGKLQKLKEPLLQDLINLICEEEKVIEQESFLMENRQILKSRYVKEEN